MTKVTITSNGQTLTNASYRKRCGGPQHFWWLRDERTGNFLKAEDGFSFSRGDRSLECELELADGRYTLGCGPDDQHGVRLVITIADGEVLYGEQRSTGR